MKQRLLFIAYLLLSLSGNAQSANNWIRQMAQDGENLWLATNSGGLVKHNKQTGENTIYTTSNSGLCSDYLRSVTCHGGKVLVGSDNDGVSEFDGSTFKTYNEKNAPFEHSRQCFEEVIYDADGNMWLGGLYYIYKYDGTTWEDYTLPQAEWSSWLGFSVLKSSADGTLWFATEGPNFDGSVGYITKDKEIKIASPSTHNIYGMDIDKQGRVWYSCQTCGLYCYDGSNRRLFAKNESAYYGLCIDDDNNVWFGCDNLLYKYDGTAFTSYQVPTNGDVYDLLLDGNAIWVAVLTTGELFRFENGQFENIDYTTNSEIEEELEGDNFLTVTIDGLLYELSETTHTAMVTNNNSWDGELVIPEVVNYKGKTYTVDRIEWLAFDSCKKLTKVKIPKTIINIQHYAGFKNCKNPFVGCTSLESIEVDEANPSMCSIDGVLFSKDKTQLYSYPAGTKRETYSVPDGVTWLGGTAFSNNPYLLSVQMPNSVTYMAFGIFRACRSLKSIRLSENIKFIASYTFESCDNLRFLDIPESVNNFDENVFRWSPLDAIIIRGTFPDGLRSGTFYSLDVERTVIYCQPSEIDKFKKAFKGTVLALNEWVEDDYRPMIEEGKTWNVVTINPADPIETDSANFYDILGRKGRVWNRISYVIDGDTVIGGVTYKKLLSNGNFVCGMREENGRVYGCGWSWAPSSEQLLYDFNAQPGDVFKSADGLGKIQVKHVREVDINGQSRRCLEMHHYDVDEEGKEYYGGFADYWIEGIGCTGYPHNPFWWEVIGNYPLLLSCYENGECIFRADDFNATIPDVNPDAPKYFPTGTTWEEIVVNPDMELEDDNACIYEIATDTIIGNITYKKVLRNNAFSGLCVRESGDKVWLLAKEYPTEILLYNFDWDSNPEIVTEYLKRQDEEDEDYEVRQETIPVGDSQTVGIEGKTYQYYMKRLSGTLIRGIGKVAELNRYPCLLSYREPAVILPGLDYHKVHWIKRNGVEIFRSESAKEWTEEIMDNYHPFIEDGKVWTYQYYNDFTGKEFYESLTVSGDTVINNKSYKKIVDVATGRVYCALREEGGKVYANYPNYSGENLIYDFGLNVGDAFPLYEGSDPWATVVSVDTIVVGNRSFRALDVRPNDAKGWPNWWVEGIGGMYHLTSNSIMLGNFYSFSSCQLDGDTLFTSRDFQTLGTVPSPEKVIPMVEEGRTWYCQDIYPDDPHSVDPGYYEHDSAYYVIPKTYVLRGDTVIGENTYKKMYCDERYCCAMRQNGQKVFSVLDGKEEELLDYDFGMVKSMSLMRDIITHERLSIENVDTVYVEGIARKRFMIYDDNKMLADIWVEGIGSHEGPMARWRWESTTPEHRMVSCMQGDKLLFSHLDFYPQTDINPVDKIAYRPFVEDDKVWKVGYSDSGNPVKRIQYYYFDGDTIINGRICKKMMCQQYVNPDYPGHDYSLYMGAWYEEDKKVYWTKGEESEIMYDFSLAANAPLPPSHYVLGPRQTGGLDGFKGVYRDVIVPEEEGSNGHVTSWLEGVGDLNGPFVQFYNTYIVQQQPPFLMSCVVGDEVIYLNDEYEDGATPEGARKSRFDFTHTIKIKPKAPIKREKSDACISSSEREVARPKVKAPRRNEADQSVYGEYNDLQLGINLNPLDEAYQVRITNESGQVVYEKTVNAGSIVALSIDISAYPKGRYTVTVENSNEAFTGEFETQTSGISDAARLNDKGKRINDKHIYNLQGQRLSSLQKGLNIIDGRKVYVK